MAAEKTVPTNAVEAVTGPIRDTADTSTDALWTAFTNAYHQILETTPKLVAMLAVIVVGYIAARVVGRLAVALADKLGLQTAAERGGLVDSMKQVGIKRTLPSIVGTIVFWLVMFVFLMAAFNILGLDKLSSAMQEVVNYIPKLLVATLVVVVGLLAAAFLRGVIATSADRVGITYAQHLASACYYVLALMTFIAAFDQLDIHFELFNYAVLIVFGGLAIGFALAFGLGGRDVVAGILAGYYLRQRIETGDHVTIGHMEGIVREVGPVATIIETDEDGLMNRHSVPNTKMLHEAVR